MGKRDAQRSRLYKAEGLAHNIQWGPPTRCECPVRFDRLGEAADFANWLYSTDQAQYARETNRMREWPVLRIKDGRGARRGYYHGHGIISLPRRTRCAMYISHEVSHGLIRPSMEGHGTEFGNALWLLTSAVDTEFGSDMAVRLGTEFEASGVRW